LHFQKRRIGLKGNRRQIALGHVGRHLIRHRSLPVISLHRKDIGIESA
jgi:hypothetical protein